MSLSSRKRTTASSVKLRYHPELLHAFPRNADSILMRRSSIYLSLLQIVLRFDARS